MMFDEMIVMEETQSPILDQLPVSLVLVDKYFPGPRVVASVFCGHKKVRQRGVYDDPWDSCLYHKKFGSVSRQWNL
jgi:hypothetical protein